MITLRAPWVIPELTWEFQIHRRNTFSSMQELPSECNKFKDVQFIDFDKEMQNHFCDITNDYRNSIANGSRSNIGLSGAAKMSTIVSSWNAFWKFPVSHFLFYADLVVWIGQFVQIECGPMCHEAWRLQKYRSIPIRWTEFGNECQWSRIFGFESCCSNGK